MVRFEGEEEEEEEEEDGEPELNVDAGYAIARFLRDRVRNIPILVWTHGQNIENTKFVRHIWLAGSTCDAHVVQDYIEGLAGVSEDNCNVQWSQYKAHHHHHHGSH